LGVDLSNAATTLQLTATTAGLLDNGASLKDLPIWGEQAEKVTCEVFQEVHIEVQGKGKDYEQSVCVKQNDSLDTLRQRVPFFKTFLQRRY